MKTPATRTTSARNRELKVVAIGGGTGLSTLLKGLREYVQRPGQPRRGTAITELTAVVTVTDDGGSSGRLRKEFNILPPGDIRNCIVALSEDGFQIVFGRVGMLVDVVEDSVVGRLIGGPAILVPCLREAIEALRIEAVILTI